MNDRNNKTSIFGAHHVHRHDIYSQHSPKKSSSENVLHLPEDILQEKEIAPRKGINWKYVALAVSTLGVFLLLIKVVSVPVEPIIIMDEPAHLATTPATSEESAERTPSSVPDSSSRPISLPDERVETPPTITSSPAEVPVTKEVATTDAVKGANDTGAVVVGNPAPELTEIELAKQKAMQKAKKKSEAAQQKTPIETKPAAEPQSQQGIAVQQKQPAAAEVKKEPVKEVAQDIVKAPAQEKSSWAKFADSLKQDGEMPCSQAQIALNQCH